VTRSLTLTDLIAALSDRLGLHWVGEPVAANGAAITSSDISTRPALAGFLNLIHPNKVQVLGEAECTYLQSLSTEDRSNTVKQLLAANPMLVLAGDGLPMPESIVTAFAGTSTAIMRSSLPAYDLVSYLQYHIARSLAHRTTLHGVFMEVFTIGVHLTGESGCGKSELALELITRGHRLVADDAPEFTLISPDVIDGTCPAALQDCLEVRGLGILNVRQMFGDTAIKVNKYLRLIIQLVLPGETEQAFARDRLHADAGSQQVLGLEVPSITLQVVAGRNLAVMVEAAVRDFMLKMKGYDAAAAFVERHTMLLHQAEEDPSQ
jgi:HPr kinase/phosphorylase